MRLIRTLLAVLAVLSAPCAALAAGKDPPRNKEGFWSLDADGDHCVASMTLQGGAVFLLRAEPGGEVSFGLFGLKAMKRGKLGRVQTEAYGFDFEPSFTDDAKGVFYPASLEARALAALRLARQAQVLVDGRPVAAMTLEGTGFEGALDSLVACANGEAGWWGKGAVSAADDSGGAFNAEGYWRVAADAEEKICTAVAQVNDNTFMVLVGAADGITFGVGTGGPLRKGRKGVFSTDAFSFDFEPSYEDDYLYLDDLLNNRALAALRLARSLRISVDGRTIASMKLEGTGVDGVLDALADCAAGKSGWWGEGLTAAEDPPATPQSDGSGTAFFISSDGVAVTAAHVVDGCSAVESPRWGALKVLATDRRSDLAVLKSASASGQSLALRGRGPRLGEAVTAGGYPLGSLLGDGLKMTSGVVSGLSGPDGDRSLFQLSAPIQPGNSGGPVVDGAGALVGVTAAKLDEVKLLRATGEFPQNVNFAVPVTVLHAFLEENGVTYRTAGATPPAAPLTAVTFSVLCRRAKP